MGGLDATAPREQVGARTGAQYDFQYAQAALACLDLLKSDAVACVFCEWHDDYVIERVETGTPPKYEFYQVKCRPSSDGPWPMTAVLGVKGARSVAKPAAASNATSKKPASARPPTQTKPLELSKDPGVARVQLEHHRNFGPACTIVAFVSTADVRPDAFLALIEEAKNLCAAGKTLADLPAANAALFKELLAAYRSDGGTLGEADLWSFLSRMRFIRTETGPTQASLTAQLMGLRIHELSEVDLTTMEQQKVAQELIEVVRKRSHKVLNVSPLPPPDEVRKDKAVTLDDVLPLLALSPAGYRELRQRGRDAVVALSRLQRLCRASNMPEEFVVRVCELKVRWDSWLAANRNAMTPATLALIESEARTMLCDVQTSGAKNRFAQLHTDARAAVARLQTTPGVPADLREDELVGHVFALAAEDA